MNLDDIKKNASPREYRLRVGRGIGSGRGKTAGRGVKGQMSRSGSSVRPGFMGGQMPLFRRLPKRGFSNHPFKVEYDVINVCDLERFDAGSTVDMAALKKIGLIPGGAKLLKVLARGTLSKKLTVRANAYSAKAKGAIESAGGKAEEIG